MKLFETLQRITNDLPGCQSNSVVSLETGLSLACVAPAGPDNAASADAFHCNLYRLVQDALEELGEDGSVDDVVVQGGKRTFVSRPLGDTGYFWHISTSIETTLGFTQAVMRKYEAEVREGIDELLTA